MVAPQVLLQAMREEQLDSLKSIADGVQQVWWKCVSSLYFFSGAMHPLTHLTHSQKHHVPVFAHAIVFTLCVVSTRPRGTYSSHPNLNICLVVLRHSLEAFVRLHACWHRNFDSFVFENGADCLVSPLHRQQATCAVCVFSPHLFWALASLHFSACFSTL